MGNVSAEECAMPIQDIQILTYGFGLLAVASLVAAFGPLLI